MMFWKKDRIRNRRYKLKEDNEVATKYEEIVKGKLEARRES